MVVSVLKIADSFAKALDIDDYEAAAKLVWEDCVYEIGNEVFRGATAIIESYRENAEAARRRLDSLEFESRVELTGARTAVIRYTDVITYAGKTHVYKLLQHVEVNTEGQICAIRHEEIPGEREKVDAFLAEVPE